MSKYPLDFLWVFESKSRSKLHLRVTPVRKEWHAIDYYPPLWRNRHGLQRTWLFSGDLPENNHKKTLIYQEDLQRE